ncbi:FKBP-type peptidyl-prolyl cis-trans isomerase [Sphingomonas sp. MAH-20]|uniref:Peptidyl-prolyl cis-trans isomerase n=1 Tax=Sphingomonas horti TaxID=2682842 RepID=A0A6I4IZM6_9SPHN|nr:MULTISPECIES: FKBP-type peptidyl-prolyl cis-trans isomerase [Sphingomonas]MBA2920785.1 FKBP-type peptidyl-prolyl cis-trans isomerase [Sphingomonas sp. CGMCC 1.13658]MVO77720.1 FKBP-type peptidyl-prolyl cis-trans isomerase [Sphingomonas horti]
MSVTAVLIPPTSRRVLGILWAGVAVVLAAAIALAWFGTSAAVAQTGTNEQFLAWNARQPGVQTTASGLQYKVLKAGEGAHPTDADVALIKYKGSLRDGTVFDENERAPLPVAQVVPGFSEGLKLMQKGGKYRLWIKPELGYGDRDTGGTIPPNSVLTFDVELLEFIPMAVLQQMQMQQMMRGQGAPGAPGGR